MGLLRIALFAFVVIQVGRALLVARQRRDLLREVWGALRWWMWALVPFVLTLVAATAVALVQVPGLDWGWGRLLGIDSNAFLSPVVAAADAGTSGLVAWLERGAATLFLLALAVVMPLFTLAEERLFRRGLERGGALLWLRATLAFGLVHVVVGIPVGVALGLSWGGLAFALVYRRAHARARAGVTVGARGRDAGWRDPADAATVSAAAAHLAYNTVLLGILAFALLTGL